MIVAPQLALQQVPHWPWMLDRSDSPWYPSARLFRQNQAESWDGVMSRVRMAISKFIELGV